MEGLFVLVGDNKLQNGVCESYSISEDGLTYTFSLRKDSFWSNGEPVTAHDFVYSFKRLSKSTEQLVFTVNVLAKLKNGYSIVYEKGQVENLGVYVKDDYTLVVELEKEITHFPSILALSNFLPINQKFAEEKGTSFGSSIENTLFNGPYVLDVWENDRYILKKNESYWNKDNINIDTINVTIVDDYHTALSMYENNKFDFVKLPSDKVEDYLNDKNLVNTLDSTTFYLTLNQNNEVLKNVNARKAIALGFDKNYITHETLKTRAITADYLIPKNFAIGPDGKYFRDSTKTYNHYDNEEAKKYWSKAKEELDIKEATLSMWSYDTLSSINISEYIKEQLQSNLEGLTIQVNHRSPFSSKLGPDIPNDIHFEGWGPDYLDPLTFLELFSSESDYYKIGYSSEEYDNIIKICKTSNSTTDLNNRWNELQRAEKILLEDDVVIVPLYQRSGNALVREYVKNWSYNTFSYSHEYYFGYIDILK